MMMMMMINEKDDVGTYHSPIHLFPYDPSYALQSADHCNSNNAPKSVQRWRVEVGGRQFPMKAVPGLP